MRLPLSAPDRQPGDGVNHAAHGDMAGVEVQDKVIKRKEPRDEESEGEGDAI